MSQAKYPVDWAIPKSRRGRISVSLGSVESFDLTHPGPRNDAGFEAVAVPFTFCVMFVDVIAAD